LDLVFGHAPLRRRAVSWVCGVGRR
jgi:hypothetical protein